MTNHLNVTAENGVFHYFLTLYRQKIMNQEAKIIEFTNVSCDHRLQVELCVDILERILMALTPVHVAQNYRAELQGGLTHPNEAVKILALEQVGCLHTRAQKVSHKQRKKLIPSSCVRLVEHLRTLMPSRKSSTTMTSFEQRSAASERRRCLWQSR